MRRCRSSTAGCLAKVLLQECEVKGTFAGTNWVDTKGRQGPSKLQIKTGGKREANSSEVFFAATLETEKMPMSAT